VTAKYENLRGLYLTWCVIFYNICCLLFLITQFGILLCNVLLCNFMHFSRIYNCTCLICKFICGKQTNWLDLTVWEHLNVKCSFVDQQMNIRRTKKEHNNRKYLCTLNKFNVHLIRLIMKYFINKIIDKHYISGQS